MAHESPNMKHYLTLARRVVVVLVAVSMTPLILTGAIYLTQFSWSYEDKVMEYLDVMVQKHSQNINRFLFDRLGDIRVLARSYDINELGDSQFLANNLRILREEFGGVFVDIGLVNDQGKQVAYAGPFNLIGAQYGDAEWFKKAIQGEHSISDVFTGLRGTPHFIVAARQNWFGKNWLLRATIDFEAFNALVQSIRAGETGFAFILNRKGEFQTNLNPDIILSRDLYKDFLQGEETTQASQVSKEEDEGGESWLVATAPLKRGQWILCFQQKASEAFLAVAQARRITLAVFLIGALSIIIVSILVSQKTVAALSEADQEKAMMNEKFIEAGRLASIGELAAGVAHEINNPVAIMVEEAGWIEDLLEEDNPGTEDNLLELRRAVQQIRTQGGRCKEITHKLLSFARRTDPMSCTVNINTILDDTVSLLKQKSRYANVKIESDLAEDIPFVTASPSELQQVALNLVNNAVDALEADGGRVTLSTKVKDGQVIFQVTDTGQGIPEPVLSRIFDPFFTTKPPGQGTGLGLSICFGIINKLGGEISVRSQMGLGTTFTVRLPIAEPDTSNDADNSQQGLRLNDPRCQYGKQED